MVSLRCVNVGGMGMVVSGLFDDDGFFMGAVEVFVVVVSGLVPVIVSDGVDAGSEAVVADGCCLELVIIVEDAVGSA